MSSIPPEKVTVFDENSGTFHRATVPSTSIGLCHSSPESWTPYATSGVYPTPASRTSVSTAMSRPSWTSSSWRTIATSSSATTLPFSMYLSARSGVVTTISSVSAWSPAYTAPSRSLARSGESVPLGRSSEIWSFPSATIPLGPAVCPETAAAPSGLASIDTNMTTANAIAAARFMLAPPSVRAHPGGPLGAYPIRVRVLASSRSPPAACGRLFELFDPGSPRASRR
ncbi:hypothetical protein DJ81_05370 [Halorubrum sp. Hd13]|nr:hypothetical protein DJ81_05370 [Halorubrum sp. Hd13]